MEENFFVRDKGFQVGRNSAPTPAPLKLIKRFGSVQKQNTPAPMSQPMSAKKNSY